MSVTDAPPIPESFDPRIKWSNYIPHAPTEKQHAGLWPVDVEEILYGGQAGGGKSDWLLMGALQYVDEPGYAALLLRKSYPDLSKPGAIMSRFKEWMRGNPDVKWNENLKEATFPSGAKIEFGFIKRDDDVYSYQSAEYQYIGFDELTQFTEFQYTYVRSRLRRLAGSRIPLRVRSATNPGGKGHQWVRRYFLKDGRSNGRLFIPATLADNPHLDQEAYLRSLEHLDPYTKAQLMHGDWSARPPGNWAFDHEHLDAVMELGKLLRKQYDEGALVPPIEGVMHSGLDFGEASHVVLGYPREFGGAWIPLEHVYSHGEPDREAKEWIEKVEKFDDGRGNVLGRSRFDSSKPESMRLFYRTLREERGEAYGRPSPVAFNKYKRASILHFRGMASRTAWGEPVANLAIDATRCPELEAQLYDLEFKGEDTEDLVKENDHGPDALFAYLAPEIKAWHPPAPKPPEVRAQEERERAERVSTLASG